MHGFRRFSGVAATLCVVLPSLAHAQTTDPTRQTEALEARIAQLEAELNSLKSEVRASRTSTNTTYTPVQSAAPALPSNVQTAASSPLSSPSPAIAPTNGDGFRIGDHTVKFGGFIKVDTSFSQFSGGNPPPNDLGRNIYLPGAIPVGGPREDVINDFNARQTRFWITSDGIVAGHKVGTRLEMDFQVLPGAGDNRTTNPSNPALRRAFITVDNWLFGQEFSNFAHAEVLPETADYVGVTDAAVLVRQPQVRYTRGGWSASVEGPETTVNPYLGDGRVTTDDNSLPDVTLAYGLKRPWGQMRLAGIARELKYTDPATEIDSSTLGWGLSATALFKMGERDDLRLMLTGGEGIGRYIGLNFGNDAVLDAEGRLNSIGLVSSYAAYRHVWRPDLRSSLIASGVWMDNPEALTGLRVNKSAASVRGNLIWSPFKGFDLGSELMFGRRELQNGDSGDLSRLTFFAKYGF